MNESRYTGPAMACALLGLTLVVLLAEPLQARHTQLYVDASAAQNGDGSQRNPYWRITDAVVRARTLRQEDGEGGDDDNEKRIVIHVLPGTYTGMYGPPLLRKRNVRMSQVGLRKCIRPLLE